MNKDLLETQWVEAREFLRDKWNRLTEEDIRQINGRFDQLLDKLQQRYGFSREQAEEEIRRWNIERTARPAAYSTTERTERTYTRPEDRTHRDERTTRRDRDEGSTFLKWLLALGLPLLLLGAYLSTNPARETTTTTTTTPRSAYEDVVVFSQTPADQALGQTIRQALIARGTTLQDLRNIRITATNGVVTVNGTVATPEQRDRVTDILNNLTGVKQVNNQLEVRP